MALEVEILNVEQTDNTLDVSVSVAVDDTESVDYSLFITDTGTGGEVTRNGELFGGSGSFPGDSNIEKVSFGLGDTTGGTVSAVITEPARYEGPEFQDQQNWGDAGSGDPAAPEITLSGCEVSRTAEDDLKVAYTIAPRSRERVEPEITVRVDGRYVGDATHTVPPRGGEFSQTIPAVNLPTGEDMPVEIGQNGDFSDCGTVTVGGAAEASIAASGCSVTTDGRSITGEVSLTGTAPTGEVSLTLLSGRSGTGPFDVVEIGTEFDGETVQITGDPDWDSGDHTVSIEAAVTGADGDVLDVDTVECGTISLPAEDSEQPRECEMLLAEYGDVISDYADENGRVTEAAARQANEDLQAGEITLGETRAVADAYRNGCVVEQSSGRNLALIGAAAAGVVGIGYAVTRD